MPAQSQSARIAGLRVLVVEDNFFIARSLTQELTDLDCVVVGPVSNVNDATRIAREDQLDLALLDINLTPGTSEPIARALQYRRTPFIFITGYNNLGVLPDDLRGHRVLHKPITTESLEPAILAALRDRAAC